MSQDRKEQLYQILFGTLTELTEYETPELIFDRIVEDFAMTAEYHMGQADTFKCMLDTFRHDNPVDTVSDEVADLVGDPEQLPPDFLSVAMDGMSQFDRSELLADHDQLIKFMQSRPGSGTSSR